MERNWAFDVWVILVHYSKGLVHTLENNYIKSKSFLLVHIFTDLNNLSPK